MHFLHLVLGRMICLGLRLCRVFLSSVVVLEFKFPMLVCHKFSPLGSVKATISSLLRAGMLLSKWLSYLRSQIQFICSTVDGLDMTKVGYVFSNNNLGWHMLFLNTHFTILARINILSSF